MAYLCHIWNEPTVCPRHVWHGLVAYQCHTWRVQMVFSVVCEHRHDMWHSRVMYDTDMRQIRVTRDTVMWHIRVRWTDTRDIRVIYDTDMSHVYFIYDTGSPAPAPSISKHEFYSGSQFFKWSHSWVVHFKQKISLEQKTLPRTVWRADCRRARWTAGRTGGRAVGRATGRTVGRTFAFFGAYKTTFFCEFDPTTLHKPGDK